MYIQNLPIYKYNLYARKDALCQEVQIIITQLIGNKTCQIKMVNFGLWTNFTKLLHLKTKA